MLRVGTDRERQPKGEVRPRHSKMGWDRESEVGQDRRGDDHAASNAVITPFRLPETPKSDYSVVRQGRIGRSNGVGLYLRWMLNPT